MAKRFKSIEIRGWLNNATYASWFNRLYSVAISVFKWNNLPETIDPRFLEIVLFWQGFGVWFTDEIMGQLFLPMATCSNFDVYGYPRERQAVSYDYTSRMLTPADSVLMYDNSSRMPIAATIKLFAQRLYQLDGAIDVNCSAQKTPVIILCDKQEQLSLENLYMQYEGNMPVVFGSKNLNLDGFKVLKTDAPFVADRMQVIKRQLLEEVLTILGVEANTNDKAERLVSNEITSNMGSTEALRLNRLKSRQLAAERINRIFGTNISVEFDSNLQLAQIMNGDRTDSGNEPDDGGGNNG